MVNEWDMKKIHVVEDFNCSPEQLFEYLEVHENLSDIFFPLTVKTIRQGNDSPYGMGSVRQLSIGPLLPFEETNMVYDKPNRIEYAITKGSPLKGHYGVMIFHPTATGCRLDYTIEFDSDIPFLADIVKLGLENGVKNGLKKLKARW